MFTLLVRNNSSLPKARVTLCLQYHMNSALRLLQLECTVNCLKKGYDSGDQAKRISYYERISKESERLSKLIENVLSLSKLESGILKFKRVNAKLAILVLLLQQVLKS